MELRNRDVSELLCRAADEPERTDQQRKALRRVRISIGSDAHAPSQLAALDYGIAAARVADIPADRIVNCMDADALIAWARDAGAGAGTARRTRAPRTRP